MRWSITLGSFKGTAVRIHVTFLLFLAWIAYSAWQRGGPVAARDSVVFILAVFACVVLHEFGHILTARQFGIVSPSVTLLPIGGVADVDKMPDKPYQELLIAVAGPLVNVVIAAGLFLTLGAIDVADVTSVDDPAVGLLQRLAATNVFLAVFNMVPAFPMDGGRVLRAALAMWLGQEKATRIAALIGQGFAFLLGFLGLTGGNAILVFIALFVYFAAAGEAQMTIVSETTRDIRAGDAMETHIAVIDRGASVGEAVNIVLATSQEEFPVVDSYGRLDGLLARADIIEALQNADAGAPVAPFARREPATVDAEASLDKAVEKLAASASVGVVDADGRLLGLLTRQSIAEVMLVKSARPDWRFARG